MKNKLYTAVFLAFAVLFVGCADDDLDGLDANAKPTATTDVSSLSIVEGDSDVIPFTISQAINVPSQFKIEVVGGGDNSELPFTAGNSETDADTGVPHVGFEITVPAYATSFEIPVSTFLDIDQTEGDQTYQLQISAAGVRTILTPRTYTIDLTVVDFTYCLLLEMTDDYGDGWNGGFLTVTSGGVSTDYSNQDLDGETGVAETQVVPVQLSSGAYTVTYTDGGGGGGAPGWDSENTFVVTGPDGVMVSGGPTPPAGTVTSGTCN